MNVGQAGKAQVDTPRRTAGMALHAGLSPLRFVEEAARLVEQQHPGLSELHPALQATKEGRPYLLLKLSNLQTEGRLLDAEPFRRACKMQLFSDCDEIAEMPKFHVLQYPARSDLCNAPLPRDRFFSPPAS